VRPTVVFAISGHGFGHAVRDIEVINALGAARPDVRIVVRTSAPRWLFDLSLSTPAELSDVECDTGIVQFDGLRLDQVATLDRAADFYRRFDERVEHEAGALRELGASLVVGDIPPLAFAAAARAGRPAVALGNFSWDWIYSAYEGVHPEVARVVATIRRAYSDAGAAWRLPLGGGFRSFAKVEDTPLIARRSRRDPLETRRRLGLNDGRPVVLASFGGYGAHGIDWSEVAASDRLTVIATRDAAASDPPAVGPGLVWLDERAVYQTGFRYEDLVAAADVVVTKPGYGIVSECLANDTALLYTARGRFIEYDVLVVEMRRYLRCRFIPRETLLRGTWGPFVEQLLEQPAPPERLPTDGAEVVRDRILGCLDGVR
jgi:L-arabinokinase